MSQISVKKTEQMRKSGEKPQTWLKMSQTTLKKVRKSDKLVKKKTNKLVKEKWQKVTN